MKKFRNGEIKFRNMEEKKESKVKLCKEYALSIPGFVRLGIIVSVQVTFIP